MIGEFVIVILARGGFWAVLALEVGITLTARFRRWIGIWIVVIVRLHALGKHSEHFFVQRITQTHAQPEPWVRSIVSNWKK